MIITSYVLCHGQKKSEFKQQQKDINALNTN